MNQKRYFVSTFLMAFFVSPLLMIVGAFMNEIVPYAGIVPLIVLVVIWKRWTERRELPGEALARYLPLAVALTYYVVLWLITFGLAGYNLQSGLLRWEWFILLILPQIGLMFFVHFPGGYSLFPFVLLAFYGLIFLVMVFTGMACHKRPASWKGGWIIVVTMLLLLEALVWQYSDYNSRYLVPDSSSSKYGEEVEFYDYIPFDNGNLLTPLAEEPTLAIYSDYPRIDGATVAFPVYGAMVEMLYKGLDAKSALDYVHFRNTPKAYESLTAGDVDLIFGVHPSEQRISAAKAAGKEFVLTPIGKEAFVFFVNSRNPVAGLTVEQIRDIYLKKSPIGNRLAAGMQRSSRFSARSTPGARRPSLPSTALNRRPPISGRAPILSPPTFMR